MFAVSSGLLYFVMGHPPSSNLTATCDSCHGLSSVAITCPFEARILTVPTLTHYCGHVLVGQMPAHNRNEGTVFAANLGIPMPCDYPVSHRIRRIADSRALHEAKSDVGDALLLPSWMLITQCIRDAVADSVRGIDSLIILLQ
jgi:hypothetical protein